MVIHVHSEKKHPGYNLSLNAFKSESCKYLTVERHPLATTTELGEGLHQSHWSVEKRLH